MTRLAAFALALVLSFALPVRAQEAAIETVISDQIDAFLSDDLPAAFDHASPGIRALFGSPERFGAMVAEGYPMVYRPGEVRFLDMRPDGTALNQIVQIRDRTGRFHVLEYRMIELDGRWRIDGVRLLRATERAA